MVSRGRLYCTFPLALCSIQTYVGHHNRHCTTVSIVVHRSSRISLTYARYYILTIWKRTSVRFFLGHVRNRPLRSVVGERWYQLPLTIMAVSFERYILPAHALTGRGSDPTVLAIIWFVVF